MSTNEQDRFFNLCNSVVIIVNKLIVRLHAAMRKSILSAFNIK